MHAGGHCKQAMLETNATHAYAVLGPALQLSLFFPHCWIYCQSMAGQSLFIAKLEFFQTDAACL